MGWYCCYLSRTLVSAGIAAVVLCLLQTANARDFVDVTLVWDANTEPDLAGYHLYYGTSPGLYTVDMDVGATTTATVRNLTEGVAYYFAVTAYNTQGAESTFSNEVVFGMPPASPTPTATATATATPRASATPRATPSATPAPSSTPAITVLPPVVNFVGMAGGSFPAPQSLQIITSNGTNWTSFDTSPWFNAGPTQGTSGGSTVLTPHTEGLAAGTYVEHILFSATGLPNKTVMVTLTLSPTGIAQDNFNRSNGDLGSNWTRDPTWGAGITISGNKAVTTSSGVHYWSANPIGPEQYSQVRLSGQIGTWASVLVRGNVRPGPFYMARVSVTGVTLNASIDGVFSELASNSSAWATGDVLRLSVQTVSRNIAHLIVYRNNTELFHYDHVGAFIASGQPGIGLRAGTIGISLDDWEGGELQNGQR